MTYCVGLSLNSGMVFMSDTRTNAGMDNISTFKKMTVWEKTGERCIMMMTAGNLATTQAVISLLEERNMAPEDRHNSIMEAPSMFQVARIVGETLSDVITSQGQSGQRAASTFNASIIIGGQIKGSQSRLFLVYPEGNFIEAGEDTPFFQIGETKYGKPILVRAYDPEMTYADAVKLLTVSFDSTLKANLSVGMPLDYQVYEHDSFKAGPAGRITEDNPDYQQISNGWGDALRDAFASLPDFSLSRE